MAHCWNCGLPDVAEQCPRCGAPQDWPGAPPDPTRVPMPRPSRPLPRPGSGQFAPPGAPARRASQPLPQQGWQAEEPGPRRQGPPSGAFGPPPGRLPTPPRVPAYRQAGPPMPEPPMRAPREDELPEMLLADEQAPAPRGDRGARRRQKALEEEKAAELRARSIWDEEDRREEAVPLELSDSVNALLGGAIGGLVGGVLWIAVVVVLGRPLPYLAVLVGVLAGVGARVALFQTRPLLLGLFAALGAAAAFVLTQYGLLDAALVHANLQQNVSTTWFPLSLADFPRVYWDYLNGLPDPVTQAIGEVRGHTWHPLEGLVAMAVAWGILLWRKR